MNKQYRESKTIIKICSKCKRELDSSNFYKSKVNKDGLHCWCKDCQHNYDMNRNPKRVEYNKLKAKEYREQHHTESKLKAKEYYINNRDMILKKQKQCREQNKEIIKQKDKIRDSQLSRKISKFIHKGLIQIEIQNKHWENILPYTLDELKQHLENQFQPGMTWDNYGRYGWHIDHIIPQCKLPFNSVNDINFQICWSLANLRPLWANDNLSRPKDGSDIPEEIKQQIISYCINNYNPQGSNMDGATRVGGTEFQGNEVNGPGGKGE